MKPTAYIGEEPYVFISYSHNDKETVMPVLEELQKRGLRFWYDEGIPYGESWRRDVADHIDGASEVIAFISEAAVESKPCKNTGDGNVRIFIDDFEDYLLTDLKLYWKN